MEKVVQIDGKPVKLRATAALPRLYRASFGKDFFAEIQGLSKKSDDAENSGVMLELVENLAYLMARSADPVNVPADITDWLDAIDDPNAIFSIADDVIALYRANAETTVKPKKKKKRRNGK